VETTAPAQSKQPSGALDGASRAFGVCNTKADSKEEKKTRGESDNIYSAMARRVHPLGYELSP